MRGTQLTVFVCLTLAGCSDADADKLRKVGDKTYDRAASLVWQTWDELGRTLLDQKPAATEHDLLSKVQLRLKWEKELEGQSLAVSIQGDEVILQGQVKKKELKDKAVKLAEATVGVVKVKDELTVEESTSDNSK